MARSNSFINQAATPDSSKFAERLSLKYQPYVYQGNMDVNLRQQDSLTYQSGTDVYSGSIVYGDSQLRAVAGAGNTATDMSVPYLVILGSETGSVQSQRGNASGGKLAAVALTGDCRVVTQLFEEAADSKIKKGDFLTVVPSKLEGTSGMYVVSNRKADGTALELYTDFVVGIADGPTGLDNDNRPSLKFTAFIVPKDTRTTS